MQTKKDIAVVLVGVLLFITLAVAGGGVTLGDITALPGALFAQINSGSALELFFRQLADDPAAPPPQAVSGQRVETMSNLRVRAHPSRSATTLSIVLLGSRGTIIDGPQSADGIGWVRVDYDTGPVGWSALQWLRELSPDADREERIETTTNLRVRALPSLSGHITRTVPSGTQGQIVGGPLVRDGISWVRIQYDDGTEGWSAQNFTQTTGTTGPPVADNRCDVRPFTPPPPPPVASEPQQPFEEMSQFESFQHTPGGYILSVAQEINNLGYRVTQQDMFELNGFVGSALSFVGANVVSQVVQDPTFHRNMARWFVDFHNTTQVPGPDEYQLYQYWLSLSSAEQEQVRETQSLRGIGVPVVGMFGHRHNYRGKWLNSMVYCNEPLPPMPPITATIQLGIGEAGARIPANQLDNTQFFPLERLTHGSDSVSLSLSLSPVSVWGDLPRQHELAGEIEIQNDTGNRIPIDLDGIMGRVVIPAQQGVDFPARNMEGFGDFPNFLDDAGRWIIGGIGRIIPPLGDIGYHIPEGTHTVPFQVRWGGPFNEATISQQAARAACEAGLTSIDGIAVAEIPATGSRVETTFEAYPLFQSLIENANFHGNAQCVAEHY